MQSIFHNFIDKVKWVNIESIFIYLFFFFTHAMEKAHNFITHRITHLEIVYCRLDCYWKWHIAQGMTGVKCDKRISYWIFFMNYLFSWLCVCHCMVYLLHDERDVETTSFSSLNICKTRTLFPFHQRPAPYSKSKLYHILINVLKKHYWYTFSHDIDNIAINKYSTFSFRFPHSSHPC